MSEVKWIKIDTDIFDDEKMFAIETQQDGFLLELVWFKILCLAGKCNSNGFLVIKDKFPYTDEMLAKVFRMEIGTVQRAVTLFSELDMIEIVDNSIMVSNWCSHQSYNALEDLKQKNRERQRKYREKQKNKNLDGTQCNVTDNVTNNVTEALQNNVTPSISISNSNSLSNSLSNNTDIDNLKPISNLNPIGYREPISNNYSSQDSLNNIQGGLEELTEYIHMREQIGKKIVSPSAYQMILQELEQLSGGDIEKKKRILKYAVAHSYSKLIDPDKDNIKKQDKAGKTKESIYDKWMNA